jgi:hypothetical protein
MARLAGVEISASGVPTRESIGLPIRAG